MDEKPVRHQLEKEPPSAFFDPMDEARWTLPMTCAWLIWRNMDRVRDFWDRFQAERVTSRPVTTNMTLHGWEPQEAAKPTLDRVGLTLALEPYLGNTVEHAPFYSGLDACLDEIFECAKQGRITVSGLSEEAQTRSTISADSFEDLEVRHFSQDGEGILRYRHGKKRGATAYGYLRFDPQRVVEVWRASGAPTSVSRADVLSRVRRGEIKPDDAELHEMIRAAGGLARLTPTENQIWRSIEAIGGEDALPPRRQDYIRAIQDNASGTRPSKESIDRFFKKFRPKDEQQ